MTDQQIPEDDVKQETPFEIEAEQPELNEETSADSPDDRTEEEPKGPNKIQKAWAAYKAKKKLYIPLTVVVVLAVLLGIPISRYALLGTFLKHNVQVSVQDIQTNIAVSGAEVTLRGKTAKTDANGNATIPNVRLGSGQLKTSKKYYKDRTQAYTVGLKKQSGSAKVSLEATGRQVPIHVINKITGQNLANANIKARETEAQTDKNGEATLVLPADKAEVEGTVSFEGYNQLTVKIVVNQQAVKDNTFALTPSGKVYFLSKKSGTIDVVKSDLDGSNRQTVLTGTGKEEDTNTVLLASTDWKYLALQSRRDSEQAKLYLLDTSNDKLSEIDSGNISLNLVGWHDHNFVYKVQRSGIQPSQNKGTALKSFNAENQQLTTIDETQAEGTGSSDYAQEQLENIYIAGNNVVYSKRWLAFYTSTYRLSGKRMGVYSASAGGSGKQLLKDFDNGTEGYITAVASEPGEMYFRVSQGTNTAFYTYANGKLTDGTNVNEESFTKFYPTYLQSPSGNGTFWYEPRDGKNTLFTGSANGQGGKEIASLSEYVPYGFYTNDYLLVSKNSSELYILPAAGAPTASQILKITDYHKPAASFLGYGGGYGGI